MCLGALSFMFGAFDMLISLLLCLIITDIITGFMKAIYTKSIDSRIVMLGAFKKISIIIIIFIATQIDKTVLINNLIREAIITYFIACEGISSLENLSTFINIPDKLKNFFEQLKDNKEDKL